MMRASSLVHCGIQRRLLAPEFGTGATHGNDDADQLHDGRDRPDLAFLRGLARVRGDRR